MSLVSRNTIKSDWLNIASSDNSRDALIDRLISYADAEIKDICQQPIAQESITFTFSGVNSSFYATNYTVPFTLTSLSSRSSFTDSFTAITTGTAVIDRYGVKTLFLETGFTSLEYQVVASVGFATVPTIIELCAAELVTELYNITPFASQANRFGVDVLTESEAGMSISKKLISMRRHIAPKLEPYRRIMI